MWDFLKRLFSENDGDLTVVVLDESNPDLANTFKLRSRDAISVVVVIFVAAILFSALLFFLTPLSSIYQQRVDDKFRDDVIAINERVIALQDSLIAREVQLDDLKSFIRSVPDTTFDVDSRLFQGFQGPSRNFFMPTDNIYSYNMLTRHEVMNLLQAERGDDFPSNFPLSGHISQNFASEVGHFGIDIAANVNSEFKVIADGTVLSTLWTINYGYVITVQHSGGITSIYKHASKLYKEKGDLVLKGDLLGVIGDRGVLSTGSHLHMEIWKNGVPQDPLLYLN